MSQDEKYEHIRTLGERFERRQVDIARRQAARVTNSAMHLEIIQALFDNLLELARIFQRNGVTPLTEADRCHVNHCLHHVQKVMPCEFYKDGAIFKVDGEWSIAVAVDLLRVVVMVNQWYRYEWNRVFGSD